MNNYFSGVESIEDAKKLFRELSKEHHPDLGGDPEIFKKVKEDFDLFIKCFMNGRFENAKYKPENMSGFTFSNILKKIIDFNMTIEIIGYWIYAKDGSYEYRAELKEMGFFFSGKHKAWIYNGGLKKRRATKLTENEIKSIHGWEDVRKKKEKVAIPA
jgi:hypothetical protein